MDGSKFGSKMVAMDTVCDFGDYTGDMEGSDYDELTHQFYTTAGGTGFRDTDMDFADEVT